MAKPTLQVWIDWVRLYLGILKVENAKQFISLNHDLGGLKDLMKNVILIMFGHGLIKI